MNLASLVIAPLCRHRRCREQQAKMGPVAPALAALSHLPAGRHALVRALRGGHEFCSRAANLGFTAGAPIHVQQNYGHGPILVSVRGALVALGRAEADKILVQVGEA